MSNNVWDEITYLNYSSEMGLWLHHYLSHQMYKIWTRSSQNFCVIGQWEVIYSIWTSAGKWLVEDIPMLSYVHICVERLWSGDRRILTFPLRYRGYVHTYAERTRPDLPFLEDRDVLECAISKWTQKIGCWTHLLRSGFCSRSASVPWPRMCERM